LAKRLKSPASCISPVGPQSNSRASGWFGSVVPLTQALRGTFQSIWQTSLFWLSALLLAGCVRTTLTPAAQPTAPLPAPGHVLVYDFVVTPDEINPDAAVAIDAKRETQAFQWVSASKRSSSSGALMTIMNDLR
jgi:hypothetical protein